MAMSRDWPTAAQACSSARSLGRLCVAQRAHARADGARGDEHNLPARLALLGNLRHQLLHLGKVRLFPAVGQDAGAELHHHARDIFEYFRTHAQLGSKPAWRCRFSNPGV